MSRKEWIAVVLVIGVGIVWQIPLHDDAMPPDAADHAHAPAERVGAAGQGASATPAPAELAGPYRTIALEVTGMT